MQFTQIREISSFLNVSYQINNLSKNIFGEDSWSRKLDEEQISEEPLFHQVMKNLSDLNLQQPLNEKLSQIEGEINQKRNNNDKADKQQNERYYQESDQIYRKLDKTKSIIFNNSLINSRKFNDPKSDTNSIKVFFFNSPVLKLVHYNKKSTVKQLIQRSLDTYLLQNYDAIKANQPIQKFQMRLPIDQNSFTPDMEIQSIHPERILSENMFDTLVLIEKSKKQDYFQSRTTQQYSFDDTNISYSNNSANSQFGVTQTVKLTIFDETYFQLMQIQLQKQDNLQKIFKIIRQNNLNNCKQFVIKEDPESQYQLSQDHEVKLIEKNRLYLMMKKYMDQGDDDLGPIRLKSLIPQQINYLPPIGINQASKYQQFQVTKINSFGIAIDRVLGIDQTKIYNYEKQLRQKRKQISLVDKFLGLNNQTGTKKPFRLIKDIKQINKFQGGVQIVYPQKTTAYIIKNQTILEQIVRKLIFLLQLHRKDNNRSNQIPLEEKSSKNNNSNKKNQSFFKF